MRINPRTLSEMAALDLEKIADADWLIGIDEVGTGALAGPIGAAAVVYPKEIFLNPPDELKGITDSKKLLPEDRFRYAEIIRRYSKNEIAIKDIPDGEYSINVTRQVVTEAVDKLEKQLIGKKRVIIDSGPSNPVFTLEYERIKGGDIYSLSIASAAILAKVEVDKVMIKLSAEFPEYEWDKNKGYSSPEHFEAIKKYGYTKYHRRSLYQNKDQKSGGGM